MPCSFLRIPSNERISNEEGEVYTILDSGYSHNRPQPSSPSNRIPIPQYQELGALSLDPFGRECSNVRLHVHRVYTQNSLRTDFSGAWFSLEIRDRNSMTSAAKGP